MTPDSKRFLHPEAIKQIAKMELRARHIVEGFMSGMHRSPYFGQSVEFLQHREYTWGDDLRHVDWKVWGKQDRFYIKQFEEDTNLRCTIMVDVSQSMQYGAGPMNKYEYACTAAASLAYLLLAQQDSVSCIAFDQAIRNVVPPRTKRTHLTSIINALSVSEPRDKTDIAKILSDAAETFPRRGVFVIISDLLCERPGLLRGLRLLRQRGHDVMLLHVMDDDELDFDFNGPMRFEGLEIPEHLACNPRALREGYLEALQAYLDEIRRGCAKHTVDYALVRTSDSLGAAIAHFLSSRQELNRRG